MNKTRIYRTGLMVAAESTSFVANDPVTRTADVARPAGHHPRIGSLFAAPTIDGATRWVLGNNMCGYETRLHEITVDADQVMVYSIDAWESYSWGNRPGHPVSPSVFWNTAMTLTEWNFAHQNDPVKFDSAQWEVIFTAEDILSCRHVSPSRTLAAATDENKNEIKRITKTWKFSNCCPS